MADIISGDQSISELLAEQKTTSQHLELFKDTNEYTQDLLLEQMQANEELGHINTHMKQFSNVIMVGMKSLSEKIATINDQQNPLEVIDVSQAKPAKELPAPVVKPELTIDKDATFTPVGQQEVSPVSMDGINIAPVVEDTNQILKESLKNESVMINHLGTLADYQLGLLKKAEAAEDVGSVDMPMGGSSDSENEDDGSSAGGLMDLFNPKKSFGKLGKKFPKLGKFAGIIGKGAKILGPIAAIGMGIFEFSQGISNAEEIIGKPMENLSTLEKTGAGLAGVVEGLTFGLIDAKDAYSGIETISSTVGDMSKDIFNMMPDSIQKGIMGISDFLFDSEEGIFGFAKQTFSGVIDSLSQGNWGDALLQLVVGSFGNIMGPDGMFARLLSKSFDAMSSVASNLFGMLPDSIKEPISDFSSFVTGMVGDFITSMSDKVMGIFDSITDLVPDSIKDFGGKVAGFFGFGDDDEPTKPKASEKVAELKSPVETQRQATKDEIARLRNNEGETVGQAVVENAQETGRQELSDKNRLDSSITPTRNKGVESRVDTKDTVELSKARMEETGRAPQSQPQPVVIQQPAEKPKRTVSRELSINDTELAMMNANLLDG